MQRIEANKRIQTRYKTKCLTPGKLSLAEVCDTNSVSFLHCKKLIEKPLHFTATTTECLFPEVKGAFCFKSCSTTQGGECSCKMNGRGERGGEREQRRTSTRPQGDVQVLAACPAPAQMAAFASDCTHKSTAATQTGFSPYWNALLNTKKERTRR